MCDAGGSFSAIPIAVGSHPCVALHGELDLATAPDLEAVLGPLIQQGPLELVLDCSELSFIDSSGIAALISAQTRLEDQKRRLIIRSPRPTVLNVLKLTDLIDFLNVDTGDGQIR